VLAGAQSEKVGRVSVHEKNSESWCVLKGRESASTERIVRRKPGTERPAGTIGSQAQSGRRNDRLRLKEGKRVRPA